MENVLKKSYPPMNIDTLNDSHKTDEIIKSRTSKIVIERMFEVLNKFLQIIETYSFVSRTNSGFGVTPFAKQTEQNKYGIFVYCVRAVYNSVR